MTLFRKEVLEHQKQRLYGEVRLDTPLSFQVVTALLLAVFAGLSLLLLFGEYSRTQTVSGWLTSERELLRKAPTARTMAPAPVQYSQYADDKNGAPMQTMDGEALVVELFVPVTVAGYIREGQQVTLRVDGYPRRQFGAASGSVGDISKAIYRPKDLPVSTDLNAPVYSILVDLEDQSFSFNGNRLPLTSGMFVKADIIVEKRRLWRLLQPGA